MQIRSNPHTHTRFSDGKCTPREMIERARALGFRALGFSDHAVQDVDRAFNLPAEREAQYRREVRALAEEYAGRIRVYLSIEYDSEFGKAERGQYDYLLLSAHYVRRGGRYALVDCRPRRERMFRLREEAFGGDGNKLAADYFRRLGERALELRPDILGHFDIVKYFNAAGELYDRDSPEVRRAQIDALEKIRQSGALLEINTGGMARGYLAEPYPARWLLRAWREMGGRVILGSDCHDGALLDYGFASVLDGLREDGFASVTELGGEGEPMFVERELEAN